MAEEDQEQKTEHPTSKRLGEARERGQIPLSREMGTWVLFLAVLISVAWLGPPMADQLLASLRVFLEMPHAISLESNGLQGLLFEVMRNTGMATMFIFLILMAAAILGTMVQTGFFASLDSIRPQFDRLSPANGFHRLFSSQSMAELGKSFVKMVVLGAIAFLTLMPVVQNLPGFNGHDLMDIMAYLHSQAVHLIVMLLLPVTALALIDLAYQRHQYIKGLRMTKQEVKDEFKQQEGDPVIKSRLRQIRLEKARKRMMAQVPKADVVVTNPTHYAVAMQYDSKKMPAPIVLAKGVDRVAERIRDLASEHAIPLVSNPVLARALYDTVEIDQQIPAQHYRAVAEVISFVYKLKKRKF